MSEIYLNTKNQGSIANTNSSNAPYYDDMQFTNTPNLLTLARILSVPFVVALLFIRTPSGDLAAALLFGAASITDFFDGYIARLQKIETVYGKLMDPLADKFLVVCSLIMLQQLGRVHCIVVMLLICREIAITGLRALASSEGVIISASDGGKLKTIFQMVAIPFLMLNKNPFGFPLYQIAHILLFLSLFISLWSAKSYAFGFFKGLKEKRKIKKFERTVRKATKRALKAAKRFQKNRP